MRFNDAVQSARWARVSRNMPSIRALADYRGIERGMRAARPHLRRRMQNKVNRSVMGGTGKTMFNSFVRAYAMAGAAANDTGVTPPTQLPVMRRTSGPVDGFGNFGIDLNPIDWVTSIADAIGDAVETALKAVGSALGTAATAVAKGAVAAWNGVKDAVQYIDVLTPDGRQHLFDILVDVFFPPPLPLNYLIKRFPDLINCIAGASGADKLVCLAKWLVSAVGDMLTDPIFWVILNVVIGNMGGALALALQVVAGALATVIKATNMFGSNSAMVAAFVRILSVSGDLIFIFNLGTNAFTSPATYCILGAMLMQAAVDVPALGTIGQAMAENAVTIATVFTDTASAIKKLISWLTINPGSGSTDLLGILSSIAGALGSVLSTIADGIKAIPLLGPLIADAISALGSNLQKLPALMQNIITQAAAGVATAASAAASAVGTVTQAALDAAVAAAKAAANADYQAALAAAVQAAKDAANAGAAAAIAAAQAAAKAAQDAIVAVQQQLADALAALAKFKVPPLNWDPSWPWPPSADWSLPSAPSLPSIAPPDWPSGCAFPPTEWPPCGISIPSLPSLPGGSSAAPKSPTQQQQSAPQAATSGGWWHIVLGAAAGLMLGGAPGAVAGGVASAVFLKGDP